MNLKGLSFDNIPPLQIPLRFFQTAPLFGILAALLLLGYPEALNSRWQPPLLGFTHLLTLGFGAMIMLGALFQVMPVVTGQAIANATMIAPSVRWTLIPGVLLLAAGFVFASPASLLLATLLLICSLTLFLGAFGRALINVAPVGDSAFCLRFAALALLLTAIIGVAQASFHYWPDAGLYQPQQTNLHAAWGGFGWSLGLVIAVAIQVIPMFHVTPAFPRWIARRLAPALFALLILFSFHGWPELQLAALLGISVAAALFALFALRILSRRKRKLLDWTVWFWRLGLCHLLIIAALIPLYLFAETGQLSSALALLIGLGYGLGFIATLMIGMLQKIVPFLIYLHLQRTCLANPAALTQLPNMKAIITTDASRKQFAIHVTALALIYAAVFFPPVRPVAALALLIDFAWLSRCLSSALKVYRGVAEQLASHA